MNSRNREQKYLEIKKKKVYKCFNIPFHVTTIHRQPSWLTFITIRGFFGVSLIYHTMEVKSLGRLKTIRDSLTPPQPHPSPSKQSCIFCSLSTLLCLEPEVFAYPNTVPGGRGRSLEASRLLKQRILCFICVFEGRIFGLYCSFETSTFYSDKSRGAGER